jgi:hypothetical protein
MSSEEQLTFDCPNIAAAPNKRENEDFAINDMDTSR